MKILHTSDWHVGKTIRGHSRADEHRAVLAEITGIAEREAVDLVLVAGDLYETAAPSAESEAIVYQTLLNLSAVAPVVVISGNHDNARRFDAVAPLLAASSVSVSTTPKAPADGGVVTVSTAAGEAKVALLPFVSQRSIVRAADLMEAAAFENAQTYGERLHRIIAALSGEFSAETVNIILAHAFVIGGESGGGERPAHLVEDYALSAVDFPTTASYVALGHLHRPQKIPGPTALHYCGSPLQLDFGEQQQAKQVNLVEAEPGLPAKVQAVPLASGRPLRTLTGTLAELRQIAERAEVEWGEVWLRVRVNEAGKVGLADEVRERFGPTVVDVRVERQTEQTRRPRRAEGRTPAELFTDYLAERDIEDATLNAAFGELYERAE